MRQIKEKILEEARSEAGRIRQMAEVESNWILGKAKTESGKLHQELLERARQAAAEEKLARIIPARLEAKRLLLEAKQEMLAQVFANSPPEVREVKEIEVAKYLYG